MSRGTTDRSNYESIARSIRGKLGVSTEYLPSEMARAIDNIEQPDKEVFVAYVVGETEYAADWLSGVEGGEPLTPQPSVLYVIASGEHQGEMYRWDGESYVAVGGGDVTELWEVVNTLSAQVRAMSRKNVLIYYEGDDTEPATYDNGSMVSDMTVEDGHALTSGTYENGSMYL